MGTISILSFFCNVGAFPQANEPQPWNCKKLKEQRLILFQFVTSLTSNPFLQDPKMSFFHLILSCLLFLFNLLVAAYLDAISDLLIGSRGVSGWTGAARPQ